MDSDFKKFFSSTMGIITAVFLVILVLCACCLIFAAIGQATQKKPIGLTAPAGIEASRSSPGPADYFR